MQPDLVKYYRHSVDWDDMVDHMQNSFQCCGIGPLAYQDWDRNSRYRCTPSNPSHERCSVPSRAAESRAPERAVQELGRSEAADTRRQLPGQRPQLGAPHVVVVGGVALLASIGLLLAVATTREYMNGLRRPKQAPDASCQRLPYYQ
ncbi:tetraspanin-5 [Rhipicephalus sanguineus]|nr:tetraspanin-5 [Rhipicephalus sanguineus]